MEILLINDVVGVGDIGETVQVKGGFARNYLLPRGLAVEAKAGSSKEIAHKLKMVEIKKRKLKEEAEKSKDEWSKRVVTLSLRQGSKGRVFGSLSAKDISEKLAQDGFEVDRRRILLTDSIRKLGDHTVSIKLHSEVVGTFIVRVEAEQATEADEKRASEEAMIALEKAKRKKAEKKPETEPSAEAEAEQ